MSESMFEKDKYAISQALGMWIDYIKYGDCVPEHGARMNDLSNSQTEFIVKLNKLQDDILSGRKVIVESEKNEFFGGL